MVVGVSATLDEARRITINTQACILLDLAKQRSSAERKIRMKPRHCIGFQRSADVVV